MAFWPPAGQESGLFATWGDSLESHVYCGCYVPDICVLCVSNTQRLPDLNTLLMAQLQPGGAAQR